ncbi:MAG: V-type ATPase subunit [Aminivibrio sp.]|nr:V-type ATPase subunit [Synergistaceae bacterium]
MAPAEQYGYAVARLRAMSGRLLEEALLLRVLECEDLESAIKVLGETVYSGWLMELKGIGEFDKAIEAELLHVFEEVHKFVPDAALVELCRLPYDFHNVKVLVKGTLLVREGGERRFDLLTKLGNIPVDDLITAMETEDYRLLPFGLHRLVPGCFTVWEQSRDVLELEKLLDEGLFEAMRLGAEASGVESAVLWVRARIDAENVRSLLRLKRMNVETSAAAGYLHAGGLISKDRLLSVFTEPPESWAKLLAFADVSSILSGVQDGADLNATVVGLEKVLDEYVGAVLESSKYDAFAPGNVMSFLWKKELETKNIRIALVSVSNNTDRTLARGLFRHVG